MISTVIGAMIPSTLMATIFGAACTKEAASSKAQKRTLHPVFRILRTLKESEFQQNSGARHELGRRCSDVSARVARAPTPIPARGNYDPGKAVGGRPLWPRAVLRSSDSLHVALERAAGI